MITLQPASDTGTLKQWHTQWCLPNLQHTWGTLKQWHTSSDTFQTCNLYQTLGHTKTVTHPVIPSKLATCLRHWGTLKQWHTQWYHPTLQPAWDTGVINVLPASDTGAHWNSYTHQWYLPTLQPAWDNGMIPCNLHETLGHTKIHFLQLKYDVSAGQNGQHVVRI